MKRKEHGLAAEEEASTLVSLVDVRRGTGRKETKAFFKIYGLRAES